MSFKAINEYLDYRLKADTELTVWRMCMSALTALIPSRGAPRKTFVELRSDIWGQGESAQDREKSAREIALDVLKRHGITVRTRDTK